MNRPEEKKKRRNRILLLITALVITAVFAGGVYFSLNAMGEAAPEASVDRVNEERSQLLVSGKEYSLEQEQEELYSFELEREEEHREEQEEEPENKTESIIPEETDIPDEPENTLPPVQTDEAQETPTPSATPTPAQTPVPTPEPTATVTPERDPDSGEGGSEGDPGDEGSPVPSAGPDEGQGGDGEGEGDSGENPTPTPTEPPEEITKDPVIECSLSDGGEYVPDFYFTLRGTDYHSRVIDKVYYSVWFDGSQIYSAGEEDGGYVIYRPDRNIPDIYDGDHEVTVTVRDAEGNASSITYALYIRAEEQPPLEEYVYITVDAGRIYTSGSYVLVSDRVQIYPGESVDSVVDRTLRAWGYEPMATYGAQGYYLERIGRPGMIDPEQVLEEYRDVIFTTDSLGERDLSSFSGWLYNINGERGPVGMSNQPLADSDEIDLWFTLNFMEE